MRATVDATACTPRDELRQWVSERLPNPPETAAPPRPEGPLDLLAAPPEKWSERARAARQQRKLAERLSDANTAPSFDCKPLWITLRTDTTLVEEEALGSHVPTVDSLLVSVVLSARGAGRPNGSAVLERKVAWEGDDVEKAEMAALVANRQQKQRRNSRAFEQASAIKEARYRKSYS